MADTLLTDAHAKTAAPAEVLTPATFAMLQRIADAGSFAAAARALGLVPSALTYRVRQVEDALDVLLFDRRSRQARLTPAGAELLREGAHMMDALHAVAHRVKRVATGWEAQLTIAADGVIQDSALMDLCERFYALGAPTQLRLRHEVLSGTMEALTSGQADLALGVPPPGDAAHSGLASQAMGSVRFVFAVSPQHALARIAQQTGKPLSDAQIRQHRAVAVADSVSRGPGLTLGLLPGQDVFTVATLQDKLQAQRRGIGVGFLPEPLARGCLQSGDLIACAVERPERIIHLHSAWRRHPAPGRALSWWLEALKGDVTRRALLGAQA